MTVQAQAAVAEEIPSIEPLRETPPDWDPSILAFACHYCAFAAADLAGVMRLSYAHNVKIIGFDCKCLVYVMFVVRYFVLLV